MGTTRSQPLPVEPRGALGFGLLGAARQHPRRADPGECSPAGPRPAAGLGGQLVCWRTDVDAGKIGHSSISVFPSYESFNHIHIASHPENESIILFGEAANLNQTLARELESSLHAGQSDKA